MHFGQLASIGGTERMLRIRVAGHFGTSYIRRTGQFLASQRKITQPVACMTSRVFNDHKELLNP